MDHMLEEFSSDRVSTVPNTVLPMPKDRNIFFTSQFDQATIATISKAILEINANDSLLVKLYEIYGLSYNPKPIKIYIDSFGGYIYQALGLLGIMDTSKTPIHTIVTGAAMSCGFMMAIHGHKRFAYKHSTLMYHQASSGAWGKLKDMQEDIEETKRLQDLLMSLTVKKTNISLTTLQDNFDHKRDWFMDSHTALQNGCIDAIIN